MTSVTLLKIWNKRDSRDTFEKSGNITAVTLVTNSNKREVTLRRAVTLSGAVTLRRAITLSGAVI